MQNRSGVAASLAIAGLVSGVVYAVLIAAVTRAQIERFASMGVFLALCPPSVPLTIACFVALRRLRTHVRFTHILSAVTLSLLSAPVGIMLGGFLVGLMKWPGEGVWLAAQIVASLLAVSMLGAAAWRLTSQLEPRAALGMVAASIAVPVVTHLTLGEKTPAELIALIIAWPPLVAFQAGGWLDRANPA